MGQFGFEGQLMQWFQKSSFSDSEVQVYIFTDDVFTRAMRFIIPEPPEDVDREKDKIRYEKGAHFIWRLFIIRLVVALVSDLGTEQ